MPFPPPLSPTLLSPPTHHHTHTAAHHPSHSTVCHLTSLRHSPQHLFIPFTRPPPVPSFSYSLATQPILTPLAFVFLLLCFSSLLFYIVYPHSSLFPASSSTHSTSLSFLPPLLFVPLYLSLPLVTTSLQTPSPLPYRLTHLPLPPAARDPRSGKRQLTCDQES